MDKQLIAERFAKARGTYTREARVQQQVAAKMMRILTDVLYAAEHILPETLPVRFRHIVEFGCGTGSYSRILLHTLQPETLLLNDLCREMEECVGELCTATDHRQGKGTAGEKEYLSEEKTSREEISREKASEEKTEVRFLPADAESLDFPEGTDLITSCSTLQWFNNPEAFFLRCHHALAKDGILAFSTFGTENMHQIRRLTGHGLDYLPTGRLQQLLAPHFDILHAEEEIVSLPFATPQAVLKHLKQTGVTGTEKKMWTRGRLQSFCEEYIRLFTDSTGNVTLTYHPIYIIAKNKKQ